jgi:hypothetical protein
MKKRLALSVLIISACFFGASNTLAQGWAHTPLKGITVRLQSVAVNSNRYAAEDLEMQATTDEDGKFMFGHVPPGVYALGCSYTACYTAARTTKRRAITYGQSQERTASPEEPSLQISVNSCEGLMCRVAVGKMVPDDWSSNVKPSTKTTITKDWSNAPDWLRSGGGVTLRIDGANATISGKIEAE